MLDDTVLLVHKAWEAQGRSFSNAVLFSRHASSLVTADASVVPMDSRVCLTCMVTYSEAKRIVMLNTIDEVI